jgi:hypothetical protein
MIDQAMAQLTGEKRRVDSIFQWYRLTRGQDQRESGVSVIHEAAGQISDSSPKLLDMFKRWLNKKRSFQQLPAFVF